MIRKVLGWILIIAGGVYLGLLGASYIYCLADGNPVEVHIPLLIISIVLVCIGTVVKDLGQKSMEKENNSNHKEANDS